MLLDEQRSEGHPEVFVGLCEAQSAQLQLLLRPVDLSRKLMDSAAESRGQMLAQRRHDAPQHVVMENPETEQKSGINTVLCKGLRQIAVK